MGKILILAKSVCLINFHFFLFLRFMKIKKSNFFFLVKFNIYTHSKNKNKMASLQNYIEIKYRKK